MDRNKLIEEVSKYFNIKELVCPHCYNKFKDNSWQFISTELLSTLYVLRTIVINKPMVINTWATNGSYSQRGLRCNMCQLVKSKTSIYMSAHSLGKAVDFHVPGMDAESVRNLIRSNVDKFEYPIRLEKDVNWCHIDCYVPKGSSNRLLEFEG